MPLKKVFEVSGVEVWGMNVMNLEANPGAFDLYISATNVLWRPPVKQVGERIFGEDTIKGFSHDVKYPSGIELDWKDFDALPNVKREAWLHLWLDVLKYRKKFKERNIRLAIACTGGHGRTGTILSILAAVSGAEEKTPIAFVRREYGEKSAVENEKQIKYVVEITGIDEGAKPGYGTTTYSGTKSISYGHSWEEGDTDWWKKQHEDKLDTDWWKKQHEDKQEKKWFSKEEKEKRKDKEETSGKKAVKEWIGKTAKDRREDEINHILELVGDKKEATVEEAELAIEMSSAAEVEAATSETLFLEFTQEEVGIMIENLGVNMEATETQFSRSDLTQEMTEALSIRYDRLNEMKNYMEVELGKVQNKHASGSSQAAAAVKE